MSKNDYIRIANHIRATLAVGQSFKLPMMTVGDLGEIVALLRQKQPAA